MNGQKGRDIDELNQLILDVLQNWQKMAAWALLANINRDAYRAISLNGSPVLDDYQWIFEAQTPQQRDFRLGALISYPGITKSFIPNHREVKYPSKSPRHTYINDGLGFRKVADVSDGFTDRIDAGLSVPQTLLEIFNRRSRPASKKYLSPYHGAPSDSFGRDGINGLKTNLGFLLLHQRQNYPRTPEEWRDFNERATTLENISRNTQIDLVKLLDFWEKTPADKRPQNEEWSHVGDFVKEIQNTILLPVICAEVSKYTSLNENDRNHAISSIRKEERIKQKFLELLTIPQLFRGSNDWHDRLQTVKAELQSTAVQSGLSWPALFEAQTWSNGVSITPLTNKAALQYEGTDMDHCVGSYASSCISRGSHIFHLEYTDKDGILHKSTLQLCETNNQDRHKSDPKNSNKKSVMLGQNQGIRNKNLHPILKETGNQIRDAINNGDIKIDWDRIATGQEKAQEAFNMNRWVNEIGFDPANRDACETAYRVMSRFCYGRICKMDRNTFISESGLPELIHSIVQETFGTQVNQTPKQRCALP